MNSFKQEVPNPRKHQPQVVQLSPLQAAGKLYKIDETNQLSMSSFQVPTKNYFNYYLINLYSLHYKNGTLQHFFHLKEGKTVCCIAKVTAIVSMIKWYYKACKSCKLGYNNSTDAPRCACQVLQAMPM
jgi:hypothetical protein